MSLELVNLGKSFTDPKSSQRTVEVLSNIHYTLNCGQFVSIVGPSGCGKSTLLKIIAGLINASHGQIKLHGDAIRPGDERVGMVFQEYALFPWRSLIRNIEFGPEVKGIPASRRREMALDYVRSFGLIGFENRLPTELSGGMKQRVAIARTLINQPQVILMDEPFASLDSQTRNEMQKFLLSVWQRRKETVLFVTHNVDEAIYLSEKTIVLSQRPGSILQTFDIDLPHPRDRTSPEINSIRKQILDLLSNNP